MNLHDVIRYLVRRVGGHDDGQTRDLLLSIDADEEGFTGDLDAYKAKLAALARERQDPAQLAAQQLAAAQNAGQLSDADLEAELARRQQAAALAAGPVTQGPATPVGPRPAFTPPAPPAIVPDEPDRFAGWTTEQLIAETDRRNTAGAVIPPEAPSNADLAAELAKREAAAPPA